MSFFGGLGSELPIAASGRGGADARVAALPDLGYGIDDLPPEKWSRSSEPGRV
jgi:hypothetical protein